MPADDETSPTDEEWSVTSTDGSTTHDDDEVVPHDDLESDFAVYARAVAAIAVAVTAGYYALGIRRSST